MRSPHHRLFLLMASLPVLVLVAACLYMLGMTHLEGDPRSFWRSLEFAAETLSTTGYGVDGTWGHPAMILFVILLQFSGVFLIFLIFPIYLIPILEQRFEARVPRRVEGLEDHVVIYRYGPAVETLVEELRAAERPFLVAEEDLEIARDLQEQQLPVVHVSSPADAIEGVCLEAASALIANGGDEENAVVVLAARQMEFRGEILAVVEDPFYRRPILLAGADVAFTPRHELAAALAGRLGGGIGLSVVGIQALGPHLKLDEIRVDPHSPLAGRTLREARVGAELGATVIGRWSGGRLERNPGPETRIEPRGILVAVGSAESLARLAAAAAGEASLERTGPYLVGGYGEVGKKLAAMLAETGREVRVIDLEARPGVDFVGDVLDPQVLGSAGVRRARGVVLALDSESATLFGTVVIRDLAPEVPILARVNEAENVERLHQAGADFALSISQVASRMMARHLLGRDSAEVDARLEVLEAPAGRWAGRRTASLEVRRRTGCSLVAVDRGGEVLVDFGAELRIEEGDRLYFCGGPRAVRRFQAFYGRSGAG